jgi:hypothetical protein
MLQVHTFVIILLVGFSMVDLCFDSLLLNGSEEGLHQIRAYYGRTRVTLIAPVISLLVVLAVVSLLRSLYVRRWPRDVVQAVGGLLLAPFFALVMEPIEDSCIKPLAVSLAQLRWNLTLVAAGHIAVVVLFGLAAIWELDLRLSSAKGKRA